MGNVLFASTYEYLGDYLVTLGDWILGVMNFSSFPIGMDGVSLVKFILAVE